MRTEIRLLASCRRTALAICTLAPLAANAAWAGDVQNREDFFGGYTQRIEGVTLGAGNAAASNAASQIINPWPAYSKDRDILTESPRMIGAIRRYQNNWDAKTIKTPSIPQPYDSSGSGGLADADAAPPTSSDPSAGE